MTVDRILIAQIADALGAAGDPQVALGQQAYMKSAMPYYGVKSVELRRLVRPLVAARPLPDRASWEATIRELWDAATHREERYAAVALAGHRLYRVHQDVATLPLYEHLIVTGAWWDLVDAVTPNLVGPILRAQSATVGVQMRQWASADDLWLRRASIIVQLGSKDATDTDLLSDAILANVEGTPFGTEFFVRKAIGWALRQYARTDADWVLAFVEQHSDALSGLSRREALKHLRP